MKSLRHELSEQGLTVADLQRADIRRDILAAGWTVSDILAVSCPVTNRIISDHRYSEGRELVRDCDTGLTLGDADIARRQARASKNRRQRGERAYWLGVARELRTRREVTPNVMSHPAFAALSLSARATIADNARRAAEWEAIHGTDEEQAREQYEIGRTDPHARLLDVSPAVRMDGSDPDAELCRNCGTRADWHDAHDGACPDGDEPHTYSRAADVLSSMPARSILANCTGYRDDSHSGLLVHDGDTCPVHE